MQARGEHILDDHDRVLESAAKISEDLKVSLRINEESRPRSTILEKDRTQYHYDHDHDKDASRSTTLEGKRTLYYYDDDHAYDKDKDVDVDVDADADENLDEDENVDVDMDEEEEEFSFIWEGSNTSPIAAEDAFLNGQIKPNFTLLTSSSRENNVFISGEGQRLPIKPQVKKVFVEMKDDYDQKMTSGWSENDVIVGPYCEWSKKTAVEASTTSSEACKKSNSTGFSKLWRFKEFRNRSNSDGRDAFVFLNNNATTSSGGGGEAKVNGGKVNDGKGKVKKGGKGKTPTLSAHEVYMRNKAKEDERRRSYLPYRPEMFGFFTNVNGGMSKNVHPF